jgi:sulfane dehydrogenase subunit SoxC
MNSKKSGRRRFLKGSAAMLGMAAVGGVQPASGQQGSGSGLTHYTGDRPIGEISQYEKLARAGNQSRSMTPLQDLHGIITPSHLHFYMNHERGYLPNINPAEHTLTIFGLVDRPVVLTMEELKRLPSVSRIHYLECNANGNPSIAKTAKTIQEAHGLTSCSEWTGVEMSLLLREAGIRPGAKWLLCGSADTSNHTSAVPVSKAMADGLVVYGQNGEALRVDNGYPLRLLLPGYGGRINIKWLNRMAEPDQSRGPALHDDAGPDFVHGAHAGGRGCFPTGGGEGARVALLDVREIGSHVPDRRAPARRAGPLRDFGSGVVGRRHRA